jgi:hypothetical protein
MLTITERMTALQGALAWAQIEVQTGVAEVPTAITIFQNGHFTIKLGTQWSTLGPAHQYFMLLHEYSHIVRGDLTPVKDRICQVWNIASDAIINHSLKTLITAEEESLYVQYPALVAIYPALPPTIPNTLTIYNELCKHQDHAPGTPCYAEVDPAAPGLDQATTRAVIASRSVSDMPATAMVSRKPFPTITHVHQVPLLQSLLKHVQEVHTDKKPVRSYMREGRVGGLKGVTRKPRPSVAVALDVSGSISDAELQQELAIVEYLRTQGYSVRRYVFATTCQEWPGGASPPDVGSSTELAPVIERTKQHPVLVLLSDGEMTPVSSKAQHHIWVGSEAITQHHGSHVVLPS